MVIQCELCSIDVHSTEEFTTHFNSHFTSGRCGNCHKQLILIDGLFYVLQLHDQLNCNQNILEDSDERDFGDIKAEIVELGSDHFENSLLGTSSKIKEIKHNDELIEISNEFLENSLAGVPENNALCSTEIMPFEVVECDAIKIEDELLNNIDGGLSSGMVVKRIITKRPAKKLPLKPTSKDFQCNICEKYFHGQQELTSHKRWHYRVIKNDLRSAKVNIDEKQIENISSNQVFTRLSGEMQIRQFQCKYCQRYLMSEHSLREHIKRIHLFPISIKVLTEDECSRIPTDQIHTKVTGEKCLKSFQCEICNKYFLRRDSLRNHKKLHNQLISTEEMKEIPADQISVKPSGEAYLRKHKCTVCAKYFLTKTSLCSHMHSHKRATVQSESPPTECNEDEPDKRIYVQPSGQKQLRNENCETCGKFYISKNSLRQHIRSAHLQLNNRPLLTEEECKQLPKEQILTTKTGEKCLKQFKCDVCGIFMMFKRTLKTHLKIHEQRANDILSEKEMRQLPSNRLSLRPSGEIYIRKYKCTVCEKYFLTEGVLGSHMKSHKRRVYQSAEAVLNTGSKLELPSDRLHVKASGEQQIREVKCKLCGKYLLTERTLISHIKLVHQLKKKKYEQPKLLTEEESRNFPSQQLLIASSGDIFLRKYKCDICSKYLVTKQSVLRHMKVVHYPESLKKLAEHLACRICGKILKGRRSLQSHLETHSPTRQFICNYCGKGYRTKAHLNQHINSHTGDKPMKCQICEKGFGDMGKLKVHQRVHTGEKPYKCKMDGCERAYAHSIDLKRHLYGGHGIYTKKFECKICSRIFPENKLLTKHIKSHIAE